MYPAYAAGRMQGARGRVGACDRSVCSGAGEVGQWRLAQVQHGGRPARIAVLGGGEEELLPCCLRPERRAPHHVPPRLASPAQSPQPLPPPASRDTEDRRRYTLGEFKEELTRAMGLNTEAEGSPMAFLRRGYKVGRAAVHAALCFLWLGHIMSASNPCKPRPAAQTPGVCELLLICELLVQLPWCRPPPGGRMTRTRRSPTTGGHEGQHVQWRAQSAHLGLRREFLSWRW